MTPFDRLEITVLGELMYARPIDFLYDGEGNPVKAIKWEAVNPNDGQLLQFGEDNVVDTNGKLTYSTEFVPKKEVAEFIVPNQEVVNQEVVKHEVAKFTMVSNLDCPFQDPIDLGLIEISVRKKKEEIKVAVDDVNCPFQDPVVIGLV